MELKDKEGTPPYANERSKSVSCLKNSQKSPSIHDKDMPPPIPPLPLNYQRSDGNTEVIFKTIQDLSNDLIIYYSDEGSFQTNESKNELKKLRAMSKASKQAELKR